MTLRSMPCDGCGGDCEDSLCQSWQQWFLSGWERMNRYYAWHQMDRKGREESHFTYELPHIVASPCDGCRCESWCDTPCSLRLKWWDERMELIRRRACRGADTKAEPVR